MASNKKVIEVLGIFALSFPRTEVKPGMSKIWYSLLQDIPDEILEAAAKQVIAENTFFPSLAEVRNKALLLMAGVNGIPSAGEAWEEVISNCRSSHYENWSHPLIEKAYLIIGKSYWRVMLTDEEMATRAHFIKIYDNLVSREAEQTKLLPEVKAASERYQLEVGNLVKRLSK
jgi:hypothetical protein